MNDTYDKDVSPDQLQIKLDNPRHEPKKELPAAMKELVDTERVVELAVKIAQMGGLNPMDRIGVVRDVGSPDNAPTYIAAEGNRRVAALMLLNDPERLPPNTNQRSSRVKRLKQASKLLGGLSTIRVVVFPSFELADPWIDLMHVAGNTDGNRKRWNPTQQARRNGKTGNADAVALIMTAQKADVITTNEASGIAATNIQRIVSSNARRKQLGLIGTGENLKRTLAWNVFRIGLNKLMRDQIDHPRKHDSRALNVADKLNSYVADVVRAMEAPEPLPNDETRSLMPTKAELMSTKANLMQTEQLDDDKENGNEAGMNGPISGGTTDDNGDNYNLNNQQKLKNAQRGGTIAKSTALEGAINVLDDEKIAELYASITTVSARQHPMLICIGCSTLLELLFKKSGWDEKGKIADKIMALKEVRDNYDTQSLGSIESVLKGLRARANLSKHNSQTGGVHGEALIKDMATLDGVFTAIADLAVQRKQADK